MKHRVELAILGGGCAGLSLARELARAERRGASVPRTVVIEPRAEYGRDRTWCFWAHRDEPVDERIRYRWPAWRFSRGEETVVHRSTGWRYAAVPADAFYEDALDAVERSRYVRLQAGVGVEGLDPRPEAVHVQTGDGLIRAGQVVDTRPPEAARVRGSALAQAFAGAEITCSTPTLEPDMVRLMDAMTTDAHSFRFDYVLPLTPTRLLVEVTRFSARPVAAAQLELDLQAAIERVVGDEPVDIGRREQGVIPMGLPVAPPTGDPRWVLAGTRGGAVRASTGYAFRRMQAWAQVCAQSVVERGRVVGHPPEPRWMAWMDQLFLNVLRAHPERAPALFMDLARNAPADVLVRFLSDRAGYGDLLRVVRALPPQPFLERLRFRIGAWARAGRGPKDQVA